MNNVIKANPKQVELLMESYGRFVQPSKVAHIQGIITLNDCVITVYKSGSIVFQGKAAAEHFAEWNTIFAGSFRVHMGSDEVGTGDFFGPMVVCAAFVNTEHERFLKQLGVGDSKSFTDDAIRKMATIMVPLIPHRHVVLMPEYYNKLYAKYPNLNQLKALLHNRAITELLEQTGPVPVVMDQFVHEKKYYEYLADLPHVHRKIEFHTKAESTFIAVAAASILARYYFLESWLILERQLKQSLPKGAGALVDAAASRLFATMDKQHWGNYAKLHFKNLKNIQTER
jgi:ribonuclease HIII